MRRGCLRLAAGWFICLGLLPAGAVRAGPAPSADSPGFGTVDVDVSPWEYHWDRDKKNNNHPRLVDLEWEHPQDTLLVGAAYFKNSFDHDTGYLYVGKRWFLADWFEPRSGRRSEGWYLKLTAGPLMGYTGRHKRNVPLNYRGVGLGAIPLLGYQYRRWHLQAGFFANAGVLLSVGYDIFK